MKEVLLIIVLANGTPVAYPFDSMDECYAHKSIAEQDIVTGEESAPLLMFCEEKELTGYEPEILPEMEDCLGE